MTTRIRRPGNPRVPRPVTALFVSLALIASLAPAPTPVAAGALSGQPSTVAASAPAGRPPTVVSVLAGQPPSAASVLTGQPPTAAPVPYRWPLAGPPPVVRGFDPPARPWLAGHRGVDLAARPGATVTAAGAGVVFFAGPVAGRPVVSIAHPDGLRTTYEPVEPVVAVGDRVAAGDPIGVLSAGHPGCPQPACLHWGVRRGDDYLDPLLLLGLGRVRLLPRVDAPADDGR